MKSTPGPWKLLEPSWSMISTVGDPYGHGQMLVAQVRGWGHLTGQGSCRLPESQAIAVQTANAVLIAAAPDLLEALKEYVEWFGAVHGQDCPADDTCTCIGRGLNARVNAAIAKAEGRS